MIARSGYSVGLAGLRIALAAAVLIGISGYGRHTAKPPPSNVPPLGEAHRIAFAGKTFADGASPQTPAHQVTSLLNVRKPINYGDYIWDDEGVPAGRVWVRVDLQAQTISVFRAGQEIGTAVVLYGAEEKPTPVGRFTILDKREKNRSSLYDADMPYTLRLTHDGISIHGSDVRLNAGTHGCVGIPIAFAALLFGEVKTGDEVVVVRGSSNNLGTPRMD